MEPLLYLVMKHLEASIRPARRPEDRPPTLDRWNRKLQLTLPALLRFVQSSLRQPLASSRPPVGSIVLSHRGQPLGHIDELVIGVKSGKVSYAVVPMSVAARRDVVYLIPPGALRAGPDEHAFVDGRVLAFPGSPDAA